MRQRLSMLIAAFVFVGVCSSAPFAAHSHPEKIRPGERYYADELAEPSHEGLVRNPGPERNYEEVYQLYTYYEFVYDAAERVVLFREYERGDVIRSEEYHYDASGGLTRRVVRRPGKEDETTVVQPEPEPKTPDE